MAEYTPTTDFSVAKTGAAIVGADLDVEFSAISTSCESKYDVAGTTATAALTITGAVTILGTFSTVNATLNDVECNGQISQLADGTGGQTLDNLHESGTTNDGLGGATADFDTVGSYQDVTNLDEAYTTNASDGNMMIFFSCMDWDIVDLTSPAQSWFTYLLRDSATAASGQANFKTFIEGTRICGDGVTTSKEMGNTIMGDDTSASFESGTVTFIIPGIMEAGNGTLRGRVSCLITRDPSSATFSPTHGNAGLCSNRQFIFHDNANFPEETP